jgi:hypothetical protein
MIISGCRRFTIDFVERFEEIAIRLIVELVEDDAVRPEAVLRAASDDSTWSPIASSRRRSSPSGPRTCCRAPATPRPSPSRCRERRAPASCRRRRRTPRPRARRRTHQIDRVPAPHGDLPAPFGRNANTFRNRRVTIAHALPSEERPREQQLLIRQQHEWLAVEFADVVRQELGEEVDGRPRRPGRSSTAARTLPTTDECRRRRRDAPRSRPTRARS